MVCLNLADSADIVAQNSGHRLCNFDLIALNKYYYYYQLLGTMLHIHLYEPMPGMQSGGGYFKRTPVVIS